MLQQEKVYKVQFKTKYLQAQVEMNVLIRHPYFFIFKNHQVYNSTSSRENLARTMKSTETTSSGHFTS